MEHCRDHGNFHGITAVAELKGHRLACRVVAAKEIFHGITAVAELKEVWIQQLR